MSLIIVIAAVAVWRFWSAPVEPLINRGGGESGSFLRIARPTFRDYLARAYQPRRPRRQSINLTNFTDDFSTATTLEEAGRLTDSASPYWWLNSGGRLLVSAGLGQTLQGDLAAGDQWYKLYAASNPLDTDGGLHPQNIFRLVQTSQWLNFSQQNYFRINRLNFSASPNRNASNGLFLFNRYQGGDDLYYTGLRMDGAAVIKKKIKGSYYTMAYQPIFTVDGRTYERDTNPNLLPLDTWIGLKSEVTTGTDGRVTIKLYTDIGRTGAWTLALEALDDGVKYGGATINQAGYAGIRTDFMDLDLDDYRIAST